MAPSLLFRHLGFLRSVLSGRANYTSTLESSMKLLRFAAIALLAAIPMTACDDDDGGGGTVLPPVAIVGIVSGTVSVEGTGLAGVPVNLVGAASQSARLAGRSGRGRA